MVDDFLKSFIRTIGRVFAYIMLAFLIFYILGCKAKADTIDASRYYIQSIQSNWSVGNYDWGTSLANYNGNTIGYQWTIVDGSGNYVSLKTSEYYINVEFEVSVNTNVYPLFLANNFNIQVGSNYTNTSCDGYEDFIMVSQEIRNGWNYTKFNYVCDNLNVTSNFDRIRLRYYDTNVVNNGYTMVGINITESTFIDQNELNNGDKFIGGKIDDAASKVEDKLEDIEDKLNVFQQAIINNQNAMSQATINSNNQIKSSVDNINSSINSSSVDSPSNSFSSFNNGVASTSGIQDIFLLPITLIQAIINVDSSSCSTISFGSLLGTNLYLPCINIESYVGSTLYTMFDFFCSLALILGLRKYVLEIFNRVTSLKEDNLQ